ncbi:MAG: hypothetical protein Cons2KO_31530 [Congregibacter sp.]
MSRKDFQRNTAQALQQRDYRRLVALCRKARQDDPAFADAWFLESVAAEAGRDLAAAIELVDKALGLSPGNVEYLVQKARYHSQASQDEAAKAAAQAALKAGASSAQQLDTLGVVLTRLGEYSTAAEALRRAARSAPQQPQIHFNLAAAEQFLGNDAAAEEHYQQVLRLAPGHARSYWALSELQKNRVDSKHEGAMRRLMAQPGISDRDGLYLAHALARVEENRGDYAAAVELLCAAKARRRASLKYDFASDRALFDALRAKFQEPAAAVVPRTDTSKAQRPLFIVGMPRTGTTLVERILTAHTQVQTLGEQQALPQAVKHLSGAAGASVLSEEVVVRSEFSDTKLADTYAALLNTRLRALGEPSTYVIDKMPLNFLYVGFILAHIPDAKIVVLRRHPMDAGLSNFRQLFALDYSYYNYSYDLRDTGRYVAAFESLMAHWESLYPGKFFSLQYETLVADAEPQVRGLLQYLELPWEAACLEFHKQGGAIATPSGAQVREPLYSSAIGRWRRYGEALSPLREVLLAEDVALVER